MESGMSTGEVPLASERAEALGEVLRDLEDKARNDAWLLELAWEGIEGHEHNGHYVCPGRADCFVSDHEADLYDVLEDRLSPLCGFDHRACDLAVLPGRGLLAGACDPLDDILPLVG